MDQKEWVVAPYDRQAADTLFASGEFSELLSVLLSQRGFRDAKEASDYLNGGGGLCDPFTIRDMDKAAARVEAAIENFEKIAVYGDYDADGVTATALLYSYLAARDADVMYYISDRDGEGYGLHRETLDQLCGEGVKLILTVDNGITAVDEVAYAAARGMDVVITDHHTPGEVLPAAVAVVDPHRADCGSAFKDYAGVGVAFKLVQALEGGEADHLIDEYADLVCIGTVGDVVPLQGENRALVQRGLVQLSESARPGVTALIGSAGLSGRRLTGTSVAFSLVPRINAAGRMGKAERAVQLLLTDDEGAAARRAAEIEDENHTRQRAVAGIIEEIEARFAETPSLLLDRVLVLSSPGWHRGVLGIVAARICETYGKPCLVISVEGDEARGSARSLPGFPLFEALDACKDHLIKWGGHALAAGITLAPDHIGPLAEALEDFAASLEGDIPTPVLHIDCKLRPATLSLYTIRDLHRLEPFGAENAAPVFGLFGLKLEKIKPLAGGKHLRLSLTKQGATIEALLFGTTPHAFPFQAGETMDLAVTLDLGEYRGEKSLSVFVKAYRPAGFDQAAYIAGLRLYEAYRRGEASGTPEALLPDREDLAAVYRHLRAAGGFVGDGALLFHRLATVPYAKMLVALDALTELGIITYNNIGARFEIRLNPSQGKADLTASTILNQLRRQIGMGEGNGRAV